MEHTPKPWVCTLNGQVSRETADGLMPVADTYVCTNTYKPSGELVAANAEFIVRAVNSHSDLLEACQAMITDFDLGESSIKTSKILMEAAIKKATE